MSRRFKKLIQDRKERRKERAEEVGKWIEKNEAQTAIVNRRRNFGVVGSKKWPVIVSPSSRSSRFRHRNRGRSGVITTATSGLIHPLLPDISEYEKDVSVIFGTYNRLSNLQRCVESIRRACEGIRYEVVVCDGGSTDGTKAWLRSQPDVKYLAGDLSGAVKAFNACFVASSGRFILTLNDDAELAVDAVRKGLRYFDDPMVGQVAFAFSLPTQGLQILDVHGAPYANYGMVRASLAKTISRICGGIWATCYYTYGGDTELSMWVRRLGYTVAAAPDAHAHDRHAMDKLRRRSHTHEGGKSGRVFHVRWPHPDCGIFRGRAPTVPKSELMVLRRLETGELPAQRWPRLAQADPVGGKLPPRAKPLPERVLHVHLRTDEDPQNSLAAALRSISGRGYALVDWLNLSQGERHQQIQNACRQIQPTLVFMQLQGPHVSTELVRAIRTGHRDPSMVIALWCGDVGTTNGPWPGFDDGWSHAMAKQVDVMLYTGTGQVAMQRARGMANAAYLQIGYDESRYYPGPSNAYGSSHDIVFLGQNYGQQWNVIPDHDAQVRRDLVSAFQHNFKRFTAFGTSWKKGMTIHQSKAGDLYRHSLMALSVSLTSRLGRYTSDRMIRSMACGTTTLVKSFDDMEGLGLVHGKNVLVWNTVAEAAALAREWLSPSRRDELLAIGQAGATLMRKSHTWSGRMHELSAILRALRGQR